MKWILRVGAVLISVVVALAVMPPIYNYHFSPLAKLRDEVGPQNTYADVEKRFAAFYERHQESGQVQFTKGETTYHLFKGVIPPTKSLFLFEDSAFDDIQLQVLFDKQDRVTEILFIGD